MNAGLILINQWHPSWGMPHRDLYEVSFRMMTECPGCGHAEIQVICVLFGMGLGLVVKWNSPKDEPDDQRELHPSHNHA